MRLSSSRATTATLLGCSLVLSSLSAAISFQSVPTPDLDLSQLGRVALAGNFDSISLYQYVGQSEDGLETNGSQSLLGRYPSGAFAQLEAADANIHAMCPFKKPDGSLAGIIVVGNFTSLGGHKAQGAALYDPVHDAVVPLPGLDGQLSTVYCDNDITTVFFGGSFTGLSSTNAIAWTTGWTNLPFAGFNGPVGAIARLPNGNIIFGGSFNGLGNSTILPKVRDAQIVNVGSAQISSSQTSSDRRYNKPADIICKTDKDTGPGTSWILPPSTPGYWQAQFQFGFEPTKLRLYNSRVPGYSTKTWSFIALPINGIMNFTYADPHTGQEASCTNECPLPKDNSTHQDFHFVNVVGMNAFQIQVSDWYGKGGGLGGIELFENDIYSFAIPEFNEPKCDHVSIGATATSTGPWSVEPSGTGSSGYLSTFLQAGTDNSPPPVSVVFEPDIKQSGNYSITIYTPGCIADNSCTTRGLVNITGQLGSQAGSAPMPLSTTLYQTNDYDKYDQVYLGYIEANSKTFRPTVTLTPALNQPFPLTVVAQRVGFNLTASTGGLNGLFEYNPNEAKASTDLSGSAINRAGLKLQSEALVNALQVNNEVVFAGGQFTSDTAANIIAIVNGSITNLPGGGLNASVQAMYLMDNALLFVGGNFTNTRDLDASGLNNVAAYNVMQHKWHALGAGVNGVVWAIVPLSVNVSAKKTARCIAVSGDFNQVYGFGKYDSFSADGIALWVPEQNNWLRNVDYPEIALAGSLNAWTQVPGMMDLYAGALDSQDLGISDVASLSTSGGLSIEPFGIKIEPPAVPAQSVVHKRATSSSTEGVVTGLFYDPTGLNITVIGGHFTAKTKNDKLIHNLAFVNGSNSNEITGLEHSNGTVLAMDSIETTLFAGGSISGGVLMYDLAAGALSKAQPPGLNGDDATVYAVATQPDTSLVFVGGSFTSAGSFGCPALCVFNFDTKQWITPGSGLSRTSLVHTLTWASSDQLIISGSLVVNGQPTTLVSYDASSRQFTPYSGAGDPKNVPGAITAITATSKDYDTLWVAGTASNHTSFITQYNDDSWTPISHLLGETSRVLGLQILALSSSSSDSSDLLASDQVLLVTGALDVPGFGNVSAALFNGTGFTPFVLATTSDGTPGTITRTFVQNPQSLLLSSTNYLATGFVVLIALAVALALIFLMVILGILAERYRRRRQGYVPAPTRYTAYASEKKKLPISRPLPAEQLFAGVGTGGAGAGLAGKLSLGSGSRPGTGASAGSGGYRNR